MPDQFLEWNDVKSFIRRRRKSFVFLFLIVFFSSIFVAFALPPIYRAESTLVIEEQQIPENFVGSTITSYAEERLNIIRQQIFSSERLKEIIEKFELYPEIREKHGMGEAVRKMRQFIGLETESVDFTNPRTGRTVSAIIAFVLYYEGREPITVQKVANVLSELFLEEDVKLKEKMTTATTGFLSAELEALKEQLQLSEQKISEFKQQHFGVLPEHSSVNLESIGRLERELERVNMQVRDLQDRKIIIEGQMANVDPLLPIRVDGENLARNPAERLKYLRVNLISLQSKLHDKHPDINKLKREIQELENQVGLTGGYQSQQTPDNPAYINLMTQKSSIDATINNLMSDRRSIQDELVKFRQRIEKAPQVEKEYNELTRDYNTTKRKYDDVMNNLMAANVAKGVEEGDHGQRFEIKNYAYLPEKPYKPNRLAIILLGFVLASGLGVGLAALQESLDTSIKTEKELNKLVGIPVLTVISKVETRKEKTRRMFQRLILVCAFLGFMLIAAIIVNEYLMPLNEFWSVIVNNAKNM